MSTTDRNIKRDVWAMTRGRCFYCGLHTNPFATFSIDHVVPRSRGGSDDLRNLVPCCSSCNRAKGAKLLDEWTPARPFWFLTEEYRETCEWRHQHTVWEWEMGRITDDEEVPA